MLKIRLMRIGAKKRPFYRVVVVDERAKRTGGYIENVGTYNPLTEPKEIKLKQDRIDHWIKQGAQMSDGYLRIIGKAPQRPPRKPKKERKAEETAAPAAPTQPTAEQPQKEERPENSDKLDSQNVSESEGQKEEVPETSDTPSPSESSEKKESEK